MERLTEDQAAWLSGRALGFAGHLRDQVAAIPADAPAREIALDTVRAATIHNFIREAGDVIHAAPDRADQSLLVAQCADCAALLNLRCRDGLAIKAETVPLTAIEALAFVWLLFEVADALRAVGA